VVSTTWDPAAYLTFADHRGRPFHDLLARVAHRAPRRVVDLGCGPGNLTALLAARWPSAVVEGVDSSAEMVAAARAAGVDAHRVDVAGWTPAPDTDVVISNAVLHWVPQHRELLPRWVAALPAGAELAVQVPGNFGAPSHTLVRELARDHGVDLPVGSPVAEPAEYAALLAATGAEVDVWETTYLHRLTGPDPVMEWIGSTALRPVRDALDARDRTGAAHAAFRADLAPRLRVAYPAQPDGSTWFPFRRIFAVARVG
ncbi:MAG: trans-aconitate 2-methyltransferase, partial [Pseudonocardiales bacterium]|nr:trans-aconitate 2-methyltransferase [Pseudonocardiales bacterium]